MTRSMHERAQRAKIAPASRLRPETWLKIRWINPWVTTICSIAAALASPFASFCLFGAGLVFQLAASGSCPGPVFKRKAGEPAVFLGKDHYGIPVMLPVTEITRHGMLIGTTGSGKTTAIRSIADSIMRLGGGFCFIDGKSDVTDTYEVLYEIIEGCDRLEDLLVLNFLNPSQSHTFNFMTYGDADFLAEIMTGFLKQAEGDQVYWQERGKILMKAVLTQLVYRRDHPDVFGGYVPTPSEVRRHLSFDEVLALEADERYPMFDNGQPVKARLRALLSDLPGWEEYRNRGRGRMSPAAGEALRQYGFFVQQWGAPLDLLAGTFNRIFDTGAPEIDMVDLVSNSRILVVLLPSLSYSASTLQALGRLALNAFKIALATALGTRVEGDYEEIRRDVGRRRPSVPFTLIADEYGSYAVEGFDTILAQGRSLGFGVIISVQELASLFKASQADAQRLIGNTNYKIVMKVEDTDTAKILQERAGESYFMMPDVRSDGRTVMENLGNWDGAYTFQKGSRLEVRDLTGLAVGEGYIFAGDEVRLFRTRYIPPKGRVKELRLMKYSKRAPDPEEETHREPRQL